MIFLILKEMDGRTSDVVDLLLRQDRDGGQRMNFCKDILRECFERNRRPFHRHSRNDIGDRFVHLTSVVLGQT